MDRVFSVSERPVSEIEYVAIAIKAIAADQRHLLILHHDRSLGGVYRLELAWHLDLRNSLFHSSSYLWVDPLIPRLRAQQVAARCRQIWRANGKDRVPYGFSSPTDCFDQSTHEYLIGPSRHGLTCASFVLAVFAHAGVHLIDYATWPVGRLEDQRWQELIADHLEDQDADPLHVRALRNTRGAARFRPEEVAAAATQKIPCSFQHTEPIAAAIVQRWVM